MTISMFSILLVYALPAQPGGTSFDEQLDLFTDRIEEFSERIESKAESNAALWQTRAERFMAQYDNAWDRNWEVRLDEFGKAITFAICPEVAFLGIKTQDISLEKARKLGFENQYGSYVSRVMANSAAESAGLQAFDYIYGIDQQRTSDNQNLSDILEDYKVGDEITLHFIRKGQQLTAKVKLTDYDYGTDNDEINRAFLGVSPADYENEDELDGVAVEIVEKSTAEEMGLQVGDVITSINDYPVLDWEDVTTAVQNTKPGETIEVKFFRDEQPLAARGTIKAYEELYPGDEELGNWNVDIDWDEMGNVVIEQPDDWDQEQEQAQDEDRAFIGIFTEMISNEKAKRLGFDNEFGAYITGIIPNSGAEKAGLKPFDYIYGFDQYRVGEGQHLGIVLKKYKPGQTATVHFIRKGKSAKSSITFTKPFKAEKQELNSCEDPFFGIIELDGDKNSGVPISPVKGSTAAELELREGDIITHINDYQIVDWQDITTAIDMLKPGEVISVNFLRGGRAMKASKPIKSYAQTKNCDDCDCGGKTTVVISTAPKLNSGRGWEDKITITSPTPRVNIDKVKASIGNVTPDETSTLRSKGVQLNESNTLTVENLQLVPNTETGLFNLDFHLSSSGNTTVRIYNLTGRILYEYDLGQFSGKFSDSVDISQNGIGNYYLQITQGSKVFSKKITLSRD